MDQQLLIKGLDSTPAAGLQGGLVGRLAEELDKVLSKADSDLAGSKGKSISTTFLAHSPEEAEEEEVRVNQLIKRRS